MATDACRAERGHFPPSAQNKRAQCEALCDYYFDAGGGMRRTETEIKNNVINQVIFYLIT